MVILNPKTLHWAASHHPMVYPMLFYFVHRKEVHKNLEAEFVENNRLRNQGTFWVSEIGIYRRRIMPVRSWSLVWLRIVRSNFRQNHLWMSATTFRERAKQVNIMCSTLTHLHIESYTRWNHFISEISSSWSFSLIYFHLIFSCEAWSLPLLGFDLHQMQKKGIKDLIAK